MKKKNKMWVVELILLAALLAVGAYLLRYEYYARTYVSVEGELFLKGEPVDLRDRSLSPGDYDRLCAEYPELEILWLVPVCGERVEPGITSFTVPAGASYDEFTAALPRLTALESVDLRGSRFSAEEITAFLRDYPGIAVSAYQIPLQGSFYTPDTEILTLSYTDTLAEELRAAAPLFDSIRVLDFGTTVITTAQAAELRDITGAEVHCSFSFCGVETPWDAATLDLRNKTIADLGEVEAAILSMPELTHIDMDGCNVPDAELDALNLKYPAVDIVWTITVTGTVQSYTLRTDADNFCLSKFNPTSYPGFDDEGLYALRYCHNMVTLDLGHTALETLSLCENMPHLKYLIIGDTKVTSFEGLENCYEIEYIEAFLLKITDLTPLLDKTSLKHLNLCYNPISTEAQLSQMTFLERLWLKESALTGNQLQSLRSALPDTQIVTANGDRSSVDYAWRHCDAYFEMRDNLGMDYAIAK